MFDDGSSRETLYRGQLWATVVTPDPAFACREFQEPIELPRQQLGTKPPLENFVGSPLRAPGV